jgi:eukaryotic-like serine/threonine-protein kinase
MTLELTPERWRQVSGLLDRALELDPAERSRFLEVSCAEDHGLKAEVEELLAADGRAGDFLATPAAELAAGLVEEPAATREGEIPWVGRRVGPWRIAGELGRGGMGTVFLAERADGQYEQQAALKLARAGILSGEAAARFLQERRILARLEHPAIARLLDGGLTEDGQPYFAMERVDGLPITRYADEERLTVGARLRLFLEVCDAVSYAHRRLVVHRDLKPSNILVPVDGHPRLLDFGIAKLLAEEGDPGETVTRLGFQPMTPEYAAPEQVRGEPATTTADVYALGIVLSELLAGRRPYELTAHTAVELERQVAAAEPMRPSLLLRDSWQPREAERVAQARGTTVSRLRRSLEGDLDTIVLTALRKEPERRYRSAEALAQDVRGHLAGRPITARAESVLYRSRKFVRRHRFGVAAGALVVATLVAGLVATTWQARLAHLEAAKAGEVKRFLVTLFELSNPDRSSGESVTARELLDQGAERISSGLSGQPEVQAELLNTLAQIYEKLSLYDRAIPLVDRALELRRSLLGENHPAVAESLDLKTTLLFDKASYESAEQLARQALALRRRLQGGTHPDVAKSARNLGQILQVRGELDAAEPLYREALETGRRALGNADPEVATTLDQMATLRSAQGRSDEAERLAREALAIRQKTLGAEHLDTATSMNNLALILRDRGKLPEAEGLYRRVLDFDLKRLGGEHLYTATVMNNLASVLRERGEYDESEHLYRRVLEIDHKLFGDTHRYVAIASSNLGALMADRGQHEEAEQLIRRSLAIFVSLFGERHTSVGRAYRHLGDVRRKRGDRQGARKSYERALDILRGTLAADHPTLALAKVELGSLLAEDGEAAQAEPLLREALDTQRRKQGEADARTADAELALGVCLTARGRAAEAEPLLRQALAVRRERHGEASRQAAEAKAALGRCLARLDRRGEARRLLEEALRTLHRAPGTDPHQTRAAASALTKLRERS